MVILAVKAMYENAKYHVHLNDQSVTGSTSILMSIKVLY